MAAAVLLAPVCCLAARPPGGKPTCVSRLAAAGGLMNSSMAPKLTDHFRASKSDAARSHSSRGKLAPAAAPVAQAGAAAPAAAEQNVEDEAVLRQFDLDMR